MINKVNVILLSQFLGLYCLFKLFLWLTNDLFLISFLFRFISCLHQLHLPLFMIKKVNVTLLSHFLGLYCQSKLTILLTFDVFLIPLLFRIVICLHQIDLTLFMIK